MALCWPRRTAITDCPSGASRAGRSCADLAGHAGSVSSVDFAPSGALLASAAADGTARLWNATNGVEVRVIAGGGGSAWPDSGRARFSADGKTLLTRSNSTLRFWRVSDGKLLLTYTNVGNGVFAVSPDGKHFAYGTGGPGDTNAAVVLARMPLLITNVEVRTNTLNLEWQGGTGLYQVQQNTNLTRNVWNPVTGPTIATRLTVERTNRASYFRVQSLEPAP